MHHDGVSDIKVQLKGSISFAKQYKNKNLYIAFIENGDLYLYPHDKILSKVEAAFLEERRLDKNTFPMVGQVN